MDKSSLRMMWRDPVSQTEICYRSEVRIFNLGGTSFNHSERDKVHNQFIQLSESVSR